MPRIQRYEADDKLTPDSKGYEAFETAGRRIGPLYNQAAQDIEKEGELKGQVIKASGWPLEFDRFRAPTGELKFSTDKNSGPGRLRSTKDMSNGGPILSHVARQMVQDENPGALADFRKRQFPAIGADNNPVQGNGPYGNDWRNFGGGGPLDPGTGGDKYSTDGGPQDFGGGGPNDTPNDYGGGGTEPPAPSTWDWLKQQMGSYSPDSTQFVPGQDDVMPPSPSAVAPIAPLDNSAEPGSAENPLPQGSIPYQPQEDN